MKNKNGFTLVELIIAIGLMAIIATVVINFGATEQTIQRKASDTIAVQRDSEKIMNLMIETIQKSPSYNSANTSLVYDNYKPFTYIIIDGENNVQYYKFEHVGTEVYYGIKPVSSIEESHLFAKNIETVEAKLISIDGVDVGVALRVTSNLDEETQVLENIGYFKQQKGLFSAISEPPVVFVTATAVTIVETPTFGGEGGETVGELFDTMGVEYSTDGWTYEENTYLSNDGGKREVFMFPLDIYNDNGTLLDYKIETTVSFTDPKKTNKWGIIFESYPLKNNGTVDDKNLDGYVMEILYSKNSSKCKIRLSKMFKKANQFTKVEEVEITGPNKEYWEAAHNYTIEVRYDSEGEKEVKLFFDGTEYISEIIKVEATDEDAYAGFSAVNPDINIYSYNVSPL